MNLQYVVLPLFCLLFSTLCIADIEGKVVSVTDGDTLKVLSHGTEYKVRLTGIDAPERGQPFGRKSKDNLANLLAGKLVYIESDKTDRYGRLLGKVIVNGEDINLKQVAAGMAWWYRYYRNTQSKDDQLAYERAETLAKQAKQGLWIDANAMSPYDWRKGRRH